MTDYTLPHPKWMTMEEARTIWAAAYGAAYVKHEGDSERAVAIADCAVVRLLELPVFRAPTHLFKKKRSRRA